MVSRGSLPSIYSETTGREAIANQERITAGPGAASLRVADMMKLFISVLILPH
jgi:hypothetical protein